MKHYLSQNNLVDNYYFLIRFKNHIVLLDRFLIAGLFYAKNTSAAYIIPESKADLFLQRRDMVMNGRNLFRKLKPNIGNVFQFE